jgi:enoyl-CoA hydratase/carnithine racemase
MAKKFFFNNETWSGEEALKLGAIDEVAEPSDLILRSLKVAISWGKWAKSSRAGTKQLLDSQSYNDFETQLHGEQKRIVRASQTEDFSEGVDAFLEKRNPDFQ